MPVSPATQLEIALTIRTAPVVELTHAATELVMGAAKAAVPARSDKIITPPHLLIVILGNFPMTLMNIGKPMLFILPIP
jgi:hypothetical protein